MSKAKLKIAPLKEVIFELHWFGSFDTLGTPMDEGFDLAQGIFAIKLKEDYPLHKKLLPDGAPIRIFGGPLHQYWKGEFKWPVIQHGMGLLAINEVETGYEWEATFKPTVLKTIGMLAASYEDPRKFNKAKLIYVDAWDLDGDDPKNFMEKNLRTSFASNYPTPGKLKNFNILQIFELEDGSTMQLTIADGINNKNQKPSIVWTTTVEKKCNLEIEEITEWLEYAHSAASNMFKEMLNPEFYASLD